MRSLSSLVLTLTITALAAGQGQRRSWKEYVYADDGFAVTLPWAPAQRNDPNNESITVYTVSFDGSDLSLRVDHRTRDCAATLNELKEGALKNKQPKQPINPASVKDVSLGDSPGLEYEFEAGSMYRGYNRSYCVNGHFYIFSADWPGSKARPTAVDRVMESFHLVNYGARNFAPVLLAGKKPDTGSVSGHLYRNEFFRFTYGLPEDFKPITMKPEARVDRMNSFVLLVVGSDHVPSSSAAMPSLLQVTAWSEPALWGDGWREKTGGDYLSRLRTMTQNFEPTGPVKKRTIAGVTFYEADAQTNPAIPGLQHRFQKNVVTTTELGYTLQFVFVASTLEELERLDHSIDSIHFESQ